MKKINCIQLEPTDYQNGKLLPKARSKIYNAEVVLRGVHVIKNRHGHITCNNPPNEKS
jgi:hypothetical protein